MLRQNSYTQARQAYFSPWSLQPSLSNVETYRESFQTREQAFSRETDWFL